VSRHTSEGVHAGLFPAEAGPTNRLHAFSQAGGGPNLRPNAVIGTGRGSIVGPALAGKASGVTPHI
jgi:hypothetical protein